MSTPNYRIYDRTGGGVTEDIYADSLEDAIEQGRAWIEDGYWDRSDDGVYRTITLECCVREIVTRTPRPSLSDDEMRRVRELLMFDIAPDLIQDNVIYEDMDREQLERLADVLDDDTSEFEGSPELDADIAAQIREALMEEDEDITNEQDARDCSGSFSDPLPECEAYQTAKEDGDVDVSDTDDQGHIWVSPFSLVGGLRENPGVWSCGGTITTSKSVCKLCGVTKTETDKGYQCHESEARIVITLEPLDGATEEWLREKYSEDGYLPVWLAEYLDREDETLKHMQDEVGGLQVEAQDISHGVWLEIEEQDLYELTRDQAEEWLLDLRGRLDKAKSEQE